MSATQSRSLVVASYAGSDGAAGNGNGGAAGRETEGVSGAGDPDVPDPRYRFRPPRPDAAHGAVRPRRRSKSPGCPRQRPLLRRPYARAQRHCGAEPDSRLSVPLRPSPALSTQPPTPPPAANEKERRFPLPHAQAARGRKEYQGQEKMGGKGMSPEEIRNQIMHNIFGSESESEVEDQANNDDEVIGVNGNNHGVGDDANQNQNCRRNLPAPAARKHTYKSNNRHRGHRLVSPTEDEGHYGNILQGKDIVPGKNTCHELAANVERESKQFPVGPPLTLVVPHMPPPGQPDRMNVIKVSNVVGIDPKPFNPEAYVEEDAFRDESEGKKRIQLNVVRWRMVKNADGTESPESNARFVKWKDGSMQLLIGDEALDVTVDESTHDTHLFTKNRKGLLQSQGKLLQRMRFMPSSLSSKSHRSLTALVDSQNKKKIKMQTWYEEKDPERAKQEMERAEEKNIRARAILRKKREKVNRKYTQPRRQKQNLTPGFLKEALHENETHGFKYNPHGRVVHTGFDHDLELEALAERCIYNAKVHQSSDSEREELDYEMELEDIESSPTYGRENELAEKNGYDQDLEEALGFASMSDEEVEEKEHKRESRKRRKMIDSDDESPPPRKQPLNRGKTVVFYSDDE